MSLLFLSHASKYYSSSSGRFYALKKVTLAFPDKGLVAIKGKSGSGKSTLLNLLSGTDTPSEGKVYFNGSMDLSGKLGNEMTMIFQHYNLLSGVSVLQNVMLPLKINGGSKKDALALLKAFGLYKFASKDVSTLSGGEKQRVAICRALASKPKVVFADEPTGALDEKNSETVMNALKEVSKKRLVVLVSHNEELIERFADRTIEIRDGVVVGDTDPFPNKRVRRASSSPKHSRGWIPRFVLRNIRSHVVKDAMCLLSGVIGFSALLLSLGFFVGNGPAIEAEQGRRLHYLNASISEETSTEVPGSNLRLIKKTRPSIEKAYDFLGENNDVNIVNDYSFFFPENCVFSIAGEMRQPTSFTPIYDLTLERFGSSLLIEGEASPDNSFSYCIANTEFFDFYGWDLLGETIETTSRFVVTYEDKQNERFIDAKFKLIGAVKEFGFLNSPCVYYSYQGLEEELSNIQIDGAETTTSVKELVDDAPGDSSITSYGWKVFLKDESQVRNLFQLMDADEGTIKASSQAYVLRTSFLSLSEAFVSSLTLFVGIAFSGVALILAMAGFSSLVEGHKDNAIMQTQGARRSDILILYAGESTLLCGLASAISLAISPFLQQIANHFLKIEFDVSGIIDVPYASYLSVPGLVIWGLMLIGVAFGFLSSFIPISFSKHRRLCEELRDE